MANRIADRIATVREKLAKVAVDDPEAYAEMDARTVFEMDEYRLLQNLKSVAFGSLLTEEEARTVYGLLGNGGTARVNKQDLATRHTLLVLLQELLKMRLTAKAAA